jgi:hypothetical protein
MGAQRNPFDPREIFETFQDHETFARQSLMIRDLRGELVEMRLGPAQLRLNEAIRRQRGKPVRIIYLKARRVQISSGTAAQIFHATPFHAGQEAAVIAHDLDTATKIHGFYETFAKHYKPFRGAIRLPRLTKSAEGVLKWDNGSEIIVSTANNANFGRSRNLRRLQLDEFAFYADPVNLKAAALSAVPKDADTMVIIPSTANGLGNEFHKMWQEATDPASRSEWLPVFFAWWEHPLNVLPLAIAPGDFQHSLDEEERELMARYRLSFEQLNWRRWTIANDLGGDVAMFHQEHPSCPEEAFLASNRLRFDERSISRQLVERDAPRGGLEQIEVGTEKRIAFTPRPRGELTLYRKPVAGRHYIIGADTSEGIDANAGIGTADPDFSVAIVGDRDTGEVVAVLRERIQPAAFGEYLDALGRWYNHAGIVCEVNNSGIGTIDELARRGYPPRLLYHRRRQPDQDPWERADNIGWKTTPVSRPQLLSKLDNALRLGAISVPDPVVISELLTFVIWPNGKAQASRRCHDDCVIALGLMVVGIEEMPREAPPYLKYRHGGRDEEIRRVRILKLLR